MNKPFRPCRLMRRWARGFLLGKGELPRDSVCGHGLYFLKGVFWLEIYIDGHFYPQEEAKVSVFDHGYLYETEYSKESAPITGGCSNSPSTWTVSISPPSPS